MRLAGRFESEETAERFRDILFVRGIESVVESGETGGVEIWVLEEDLHSEAVRILERYRVNSDAAEFRDAARLASEQRSRQDRERNARRSEVVDGARLGYERAYPAQNWVTILLIVLSVGLAFFSKFGEDRKVLAPYMISNYYRDASGVSYHLPTVREHGGVLSEGGVFTGLGVLPEVFRGEAWRLVTPIFIHFGLLHLLFNLTMLWNLGGAIEGRFGAMYFGILVGVLALGSNLAQVFWSSPNFGGMSGVDYGLFGFLWIRGNRDRYATWQVPSGTVRVMLIWFFVCAIGVIPDVANGAHAGGLFIGMLWGWISARR